MFKKEYKLLLILEYSNGGREPDKNNEREEFFWGLDDKKV